MVLIIMLLPRWSVSKHHVMMMMMIKKLSLWRNQGNIMEIHNEKDDDDVVNCYVIYVEDKL